MSPKAESQVPPTILKRRKRVAAQTEAKKKTVAAFKKVQKEKRRVIFKSAQRYAKEYRTAARNLVQCRRAARAAGNYFVEPEAKVAIVVRIRGINGVDPRTKKILQLFRLRQINNAVFVKLNKATINMLRLVEPYIAYGYPSLKTVRTLVYKRGYAKVNHQRVPIVDNLVVEKELGKQGLICVEDLIHEIFTCGPHFRELNSPTKGLDKKRNHFIEGGQFGNREEHINELVQRMA